jgi:hypothetical protein
MGRKMKPTATIAAILILAGCGGSSPAGTAGRGGSNGFRKAFVAFAVCMRSHGLSGYPDPQVWSSGGEVHAKIGPGSLNPDTPAFKAADHACHNLLPDGGVPGGGGVSAQAKAQDLAFADCMRSNGVPGFPDPSHDGAFDLPPAINPQAPRYQSAMRACAKVQPSSLSINQSPPGH